MSELLTDRGVVLRIIAEEGEGAIECKNSPAKCWCGVYWPWMATGTFEMVQWRRKPVPVPPGDLTWEYVKSELITNRKAVFRIIGNEGDDAVQCRNSEGCKWRAVYYPWLEPDTFPLVEWRRKPVPVPPGDLTYEEARACIERHEPIQKFVLGEWLDSDANQDWDVNQLAAPQAYRRKLIKRVPLEAKDVPPGSVFKSNKCAYGDWVAPYAVTNVGVWFVRTNEWNYAALMDGWEIKRPGEDWKPCSKEATE
jgi:hypothetical protein